MKQPDLMTEYRVVAEALDQPVVLKSDDEANLGWIFEFDLVPGRPDVLRRCWAEEDARKFITKVIGACPEASPYLRVQSRQRTDWTDV